MGNRFWPHYIEDVFPKILENNALRKIRFHDLRHTCATLSTKWDPRLPKSALVEFLVDDFAFEIIHKSTWHINTILTFTKKK